ncbi:MAG: hypothetical protein IPK17_04790 [Chloroflexi bacterium]|uniref:hypothetical protein n=1 Tax=Candidatus Flexifilum breve TaxID=3140694 RepID=UPI00313522C8|nr:hypothetical protein [Chloroflexota bacterium]
MISRRDFLKAAGITLFAAHVPGFISATPAAATPNFVPLYGRILRGHGGLWTDSIIPIHATLPDGYQTPHGLIPKRNLQPMLTSAVYQTASNPPPFTAEVVGASAVLHRWCNSDAPPVESVGHGGLLRVVDRLSYDGVDWYGVDLHGDGRLFWTHSAPLAPLTLPASVPDLTLRLDHSSYTLTALQGDRALFSVPFGTKYLPADGDFSLSQQTLIAETQIYRRLAPFVTSFSDQVHLYGAYWHNDFGGFSHDEGIQVPPYIAKWIYGASQGGARVMIT